MNKTYLISGGAGFLGSHLCETLLKTSNVICIDNFITGNFKNLETFKANPNFKLIQQDITLPFSISEKLDGIFHFASLASPVDYQNHPIETLRVGSQGSENLLKLAVKNTCPILLASTSEVYGDPEVHPQVESYWGNVNPIGVRSCYDESKRYAEALFMAYHRKHQLDTKIIRIFNTYGPRMRTNDGRVVPNFCMQVLENKALTVYGEGQQTRSFCYVDDLIKGVLLAFEKGDNNPINLGNPDEYTILDFANQILAISNSQNKIINRPMPKDDPRQRKPDITRAQQLLGWSPTTSLESGLKNTYDYFKKLHEQLT